MHARWATRDVGRQCLDFPLARHTDRSPETNGRSKQSTRGEGLDSSLDKKAMPTWVTRQSVERYRTDKPFAP
jgi:hypothetical protein